VLGTKKKWRQWEVLCQGHKVIVWFITAHLYDSCATGEINLMRFARAVYGIIFRGDLKARQPSRKKFHWSK
jgi:hypothetical protein